MSDTVTVRGFVASEVRRSETQSGDELATFRLGSTARRFNRQQNAWEDGGSNWYSVSCFRGLARNVAHSLRKGEKVIVQGKVRMWDSIRPDGHPVTNFGIEAESVGHDLMWGISSYRRNSKDAPVPWVAVQAPELDGDPTHAQVDTETGEIPEVSDAEAAEGERASGWEEDSNAVDDESPSETVHGAEEAIQAA